MSTKPIPIGEIKKLADDIRLIKDFAENHNFDATLINATIKPKKEGIKSWDWPVVCTVVFLALLIVAIGTLNFSEKLSPGAFKFIFSLGLLCVLLASISFHKKFENTTITLLACCGLIVVLLIGGGIFTPKEAVDEIQKFKQK